jgi:2-hydroxychromene-2-carboxylate isomerase
MITSVELWFEFASTYSYPAAMRIEALAAASGVRVEWKPFLLGPIFASQGWSTSPFNVYPVKGKYMWRDLERICARQGLPLVKQTTFPRNGLAAARVTLALDEADRAGFVRDVYRASFGEDRDISSPDVLGEILGSRGLDGGAVLARAQSPEVKEQLRAQTAQAQALGIFGAPTVVVGGELFWGNDRLEDALDWAVHGPSRLTARTE